MEEEKKDQKQAVLSINVATVWGIIGVAIGLLCSYPLFFHGGKVPPNPGVLIRYHPVYQLANTFLTAALVYGVYRRCLPCAIILIVNIVLHTAYINATTGRLIIFLPIVSIAIYSWAICGMLTLKRSR